MQVGVFALSTKKKKNTTKHVISLSFVDSTVYQRSFHNQSSAGVLFEYYVFYEGILHLFSSWEEDSKGKTVNTI